MAYFLHDHEDNTLETFDTEEELTNFLVEQVESTAENYGLFNLDQRISSQFTCVKGEIVKIKADYNFSLTLG